MDYIVFASLPWVNQQARIDQKSCTSWCHLIRLERKKLLNILRAVENSYHVLTAYALKLNILTRPNAWMNLSKKIIFSISRARLSEKEFLHQTYVYKSMCDMCHFLFYCILSFTSHMSPFVFLSVPFYTNALSHHRF